MWVLFKLPINIIIRGTENENRSIPNKAKKYYFKKTMKRKVEEKQIKELLELFLSLPNDTQHYWGTWYKVGREIERQREKEKEANEAKEKRV